MRGILSTNDNWSICTSNKWRSQPQPLHSAQKLVTMIVLNFKEKGYIIDVSARTLKSWTRSFSSEVAAQSESENIKHLTFSPRQVLHFYKTRKWLMRTTVEARICSYTGSVAYQFQCFPNQTAHSNTWFMNISWYETPKLVGVTARPLFFHLLALLKFSTCVRRDL